MKRDITKVKNVKVEKLVFWEKIVDKIKVDFIGVFMQKGMSHNWFFLSGYIKSILKIYNNK